MSKLHWLAFVGVAVATAFVARAVLDRDVPPDDPARPLQSTEPSFVNRRDGPYDDLDTLREPVVRTAVPANIRELELARRAQRPVDQRRRTHGRTYDEVLKGEAGDQMSAGAANPKPPTACGSVEPVPRNPERRNGPYHVHDRVVGHFEGESGFGFMRTLFREKWPELDPDSPVINRIELVSLLTEAEPSVYVLDEVATPARARLAQRRPLDEFEQRGLDAVRRGENLVWTRDAPTRMFGAIRARSQCLECHAAARKGDLLGAFTYYLDARVDELGVEMPPEE
jgi:hypothetical protein